LITTSLQLNPRSPLFVVPTHLRGHRIPLSHCPVPQTNIPVIKPPIKQTFCKTSNTQYIDPPTPLPSSLSLKNKSHENVRIHSPRIVRKNVCCLLLVRNCSHCARNEASRINRLRYICGGEEGRDAKGSAREEAFEVSNEMMGLVDGNVYCASGGGAPFTS
jgi:hypothetical protein